MLKLLSKTLVLILVGIFALSSCQFQKSDNSDSALYQQGDDSDNRDPEFRKDPFDEYIMSAADKEGVISKAMSILVANCMKSRGFDENNIPTANPVDDSDTPSYDDFDMPIFDESWGIVNTEYAKKFGYTPPGFALDPNMWLDPATNEWKIKDGAGIRASENLDYSKALLSDENGCSNIGEEGFYDGFEKRKDTEYLVNNIKQEAVEKAKGDKRVKQKVFEWSKCMDKQGFEIDWPPSSGHDYTEKKTQEEYVQIAIADATCKKETNFLDGWYDILDEYENEAIQKDLPKLTEEKEYLNAMIAHAQDIIKQNGE
jgi:hypothetical protein